MDDGESDSLIELRDGTKSQEAILNSRKLTRRVSYRDVTNKDSRKDYSILRGNPAYAHRPALSMEELHFTFGSFADAKALPAIDRQTSY